MILSIDIVLIINKFLPIIPDWLIHPGAAVRFMYALAVLIIASLIVLGGYINARNPIYREVKLQTNKNGHGHESFRIAMASDIHLGTIISNSRADHLVDMINAKNPDLVLLAGDVIDEDLKPVIENNLGESLRKIRSKYGVFAINGNHEYIGGAEEAVRYLEQHGINMLRDETLEVAESLTLVGREDRSSARFGGKERLPLSVLMKSVSHDKYIILMDHQPFHLEEGRLAGADLQLSGHTHQGQLWPVNYITNRIYELDFGTLTKDGSTAVVSSGFGTWGPPVRTGNRPEIVVIDILFVTTQVFTFK
jgi:predicted MPP superfamily phosphohydrolase